MFYVALHSNSTIDLLLVQFHKMFHVAIHSNSTINLLLFQFQIISHSGSCRCGYILTLLFIYYSPVPNYELFWLLYVHTYSFYYIVLARMRIYIGVWF